MRKAIVTIRCKKCDHVETQTIDAWGLLKTTCGCAGPYQILERQWGPELPDEGEEKSAKKKAEKAEAKAGGGDAAG